MSSLTKDRLHQLPKLTTLALAATDTVALVSRNCTAAVAPGFDHNTTTLTVSYTEHLGPRSRATAEHNTDFGRIAGLKEPVALAIRTVDHHSVVDPTAANCRYRRGTAILGLSFPIIVAKISPQRRSQPELEARLHQLAIKVAGKRRGSVKHLHLVELGVGRHRS